MHDQETVRNGVVTTGSGPQSDNASKMLGSTAKYLDDERGRLATQANANLARIFDGAIRRLGSRVEEPGAVNPRVLKQVWDEGRFIEDELVAEYFAGLLASARSKDGRDDRVLSLLSTVRDLSVFDLQFHFLVYSTVRRLFVGQRFSVAVQEDRVRSGVFLPFRVYVGALSLDNGPAAQELAAHSLITLIKYELIDHRFTMGPAEKLKQQCPRAQEPGMIVIPSFFGAELFLWAHGYAGRCVDELLCADLAFDSAVPMRIPGGAIPLSG